jgi:hypothetical protein
MNNIRPLLCFLAFFIVIQLNGQDLPDAWSISADGRMLTAGGEHDEGFYGQNIIQDVELEFLQSNYWQLLENNYDSGTDLLATCWINGVQYDSVGVRFKGATSYFQNNTEKKSFNITLDYIIEGQDIEGYNTFNLNCGWRDNSSMREVLFNNIGHNYYMSLKSNYVNLTINGQNWGPYQNVQQFDSDYIKEWYLSNEGTIWRCLRTDFVPGTGGGPGGPNFGAGESTLNYNGPDSSDYNTDYTLKRTEQEEPWAGLIEACDVLNHEPLETLEEELSKVLDIDKTCWFLAHEVIFSDDDSYIFKGGMDYYAYYEAETGRLVPMEYDGNSVLASNKLNWDLFYNENDVDFPLMNRMLAVPSIRQRYLAHVRVILEDYFNSTYADTKIDNWADLIDDFVRDDPKRFYSYNQFQSALSSLKQTIVTRRNFLMNDSEMTNVEPLIIDGVSYSVNGNTFQSPNAAHEVEVIANISGISGIAAVWLHYGEGFTGVFSKIEMFDDGLHNDGSANDGQFGGVIPSFTSGTYVRFYIEAIADDDAFTASYEPKGAEHDVFIYKVELETASDTPVVINELMAQNDAAVADSYGEYDDWLELYNRSSSMVDLSEWTLSDDINELDKFTIPPGTMMNPDSYLVIWADNDGDQGDFHANFKLSAAGESLFLLNINQELVDEVSFPEAILDQSYSRVPNGVGSFEYQNHTLGVNNDLSSEIDEISQIFEVDIYPNPAKNYISVDIEGRLLMNSTLEILNVNGQVVYVEDLKHNQNIQLDDFNSGIYFIRLKIGDNVLMNKFIKI